VIAEAGRVAVMEIFDMVNANLRFPIGTSSLTGYYTQAVSYSRVIMDEKIVDQMRMGMMT
jgi:hypothetical protein